MSKITKLGYGVIVFDDVCHLRNMLTEVRTYCDEIVVCLQNESYYGNPIDQNVVKHIGKLVEEKLVDDVIWFKPENLHEEEGNHSPRFVETDKRNYILDFLEKNGCSHAMVIDSDEFYDAEDFERAKGIIDRTPQITTSYCQYINYYRDYRHLMVWPFLCYVPFITEIKYRFDFKNGSFDKPSDPTRRYLMTDPGDHYCVLSFGTVKMHHLSWIRQDIRQKIDNWSSRKYFDNAVGLRDRILDRYENYKDGQNAVIMFNTPNYEVVVNKLSKQYINPKYDLTEI
jgi:hypothetical protein